MKKFLIALLMCISMAFCGCEQKNNSFSSVNSSETYLRMGMYYQQLGKESYDPKTGIYFKDVDEFAQKNYDNASYFDNWMKSNDSGLYKITKSDINEYDFRLELNNYVDFKDIVLYGKALKGKDKIELYEYTPNEEYTMCFYGTYLSDKYINENNYTEFNWDGIK